MTILSETTNRSFISSPPTFLSLNRSKSMEKNSMKHNNTTRDFNNRSNNHNKVNVPWDYSSKGTYEDDYVNGFSWPPRSYRCSFCKREFRSAQALGGHMNVHRRDRARLRQSPPRDIGKCPIPNLNLNPNQNPNPYPNFQSPSPSSTRIPPNTCTLPSLVSPSLSSSSFSPGELKKWDTGTIFLDHLRPIRSDLAKEKSGKSVFGVKEFDGFTNEDECKILKKPEIVRLELGIGFATDSKKDVDLELRLGYT